MADKNTFLEATAQSFSDTLHRVIGNTFIIEYGIVKAIPAEGVVTVEMSVAEKASEIIITDCVLASLASSSFSVRIEPNIDDKVIVLFPRKFNNDMFQQDENEPIIKDASTGYNVLSGIAILLNQYQENTHKNFLDISNGVLTLKLAYSENDDKNFINLTTDDKGKITLSNDKATTSLAEDGAFSFSNNKAETSISADGDFFLSNDKASVSLDKNGLLSFSSGDVAVTTNTNNEITITNKKTTITVDKNGKVTIETEGDIELTTDKDINMSAKNVAIDCSSFKVNDSNGKNTLLEASELEASE